MPPVLGISTGDMFVNQPHPWVLSGTIEMKWKNPHDLCATVAMTWLAPNPLPELGAYSSAAGFWIIKWVDSTGTHDHPEGRKSVFSNGCKRVVFDVDGLEAWAQGIARVDYFS
jgi:hypothetical protein